MKLAIMQPYFFPYLGYFQLIHAVDKCILYDNVNYIKKGWVNRNRLLEMNKTPVYIYLPLKQSSSNKLIKEIEIDNTKPWKTTFLKIIEHNYKRSNFFEEVYPIIKDIIMFDEANLSRFNYNLLKTICTELKIEMRLYFKSEEYEQIEMEICNEDKFYRMHSRIIEICKYEKAETYVNPIGGQELYNKKYFGSYGIELLFLNTQEYHYEQNSREYFDHLSIIDVLMNCGKEKTIRMLGRYDLV